MRRLLPLLVALSISAPRAGAAEPACVLVLATSVGEQALVLAASSEAVDPPILALPGVPCETDSPALRVSWLRSRSSTWSSAELLPEGLEGGLFEHDGRAWFVRLRDRRGALGPSIEVGPLRPDPASPVHSIPREPSAGAVALAMLDPWHFSLVQLLPGGDLLIDELTTHGPGEEVEREASLLAGTGWPEGSTLLGAAGRPGLTAVFGLDTDGRLHVGVAEDGAWSSLSPLQLEPRARALPLWVGDSAVLLALSAGELALWRLVGLSWESLDRLDLGVRPSAWTATTLGRDRRSILVAALDGMRLRAWTWSEGEFREEEIPEGEASSVVAAPPLEARPDPKPREHPRRLIAFLVLIALAGALLTVRLGFGRRGDQKSSGAS